MLKGILILTLYPSIENHFFTVLKTTPQLAKNIMVLNLRHDII